MLFELRRYETHPGKRDELVAIMEAEIIPFQASKGVVIVGSFVDEENPDVYVWMRRFNDEEHRKALYAAVYESDFWKDDIAPRMPAILNRETIRVTRLIPTATSVIR
jgi:quinol monooxygenase YgiN